eukprot:9537254-Alexandrium_andersonii.AAC.1
MGMVRAVDVRCIRDQPTLDSDHRVLVCVVRLEGRRNKGGQRDERLRLPLRWGDERRRLACEAAEH